MSEFENRGHLVPLWRKPDLPEGYIFTYQGVCKLTNLSADDAKSLRNADYNHNQEPLVQPVKVAIHHRVTNIFNEKDLEVFIKIKLLIAEGLHVPEAMNLLRGENLTIDQILKRPQSIRHIIITKPEIFCRLDT